MIVMGKPLTSPYKIKFEYIKGIKNTLADTMSHLIKIIPDTKPPPEPEGYEFGYHAFEELDPIKTTKDEEDICDICDTFSIGPQGILLRAPLIQLYKTYDEE